MAMPPDIQRKKIKERLSGLAGKPRLQEISKILSELPGYNTGPYGEIKKELAQEIKKTKTKSKIQHKDWLGIEKQGDYQFCIVGRPSAGKSSLISELSGIQTKIASYEFTTLKPIPATIKLNGSHIQLVDLPGLIPGASDDAGGGKKLLGIIKNSNAIIFLIDLTKRAEESIPILEELKKSNIKKPIIFVGNKIDLASSEKNIKDTIKIFPDLIPISIYKKIGLEKLKDEIWNQTNLIRVYTNNDKDPMILQKNSSVKDAILSIHKKLLEEFESARISGPSAKFQNQKVGLTHILQDTDEIKIITK